MKAREAKYLKLGQSDGLVQRADGKEAVKAEINRLSEFYDIPPKDALALTLKRYRERLEAAPSLTRYPELRGYRECLDAYHIGFSQSAGLTIEETFVLQNSNFMVFETYRHVERFKPRDRSNASPMRAECTRVFFPHSDQGPLIGYNLDVPWSKPPGEPSWLVVNRAGLISTGVSSGIYDDEVSPEIFPVNTHRLVAELCATTREAVETFARYNHFWGPGNLLVADAKGEAGVFEKSNCRYGYRPSTDGFAGTTGMAAEDPTFKTYLWETRERSLEVRGMNQRSYDWAFWKSCEARSSRLLELIDSAKGDPTFAAMQRIVYDHTGKPGQINLDGSQCHPDEELPAWTVLTAVYALDARRAVWSAADPPNGTYLTPRREKRFEDVEFVF